MPGFFLRRGSEVTGPHDAAAVRSMAQRGELGADDEISRDARTWRRLRDVRGFAPGAPVDAPEPPAPADDPITLAEVAAPVWAVLRRAGAAAAKAAGNAARTAANAAAEAAASTRKSMRDAAEARREATIIWRSDEPIEWPMPIPTPLGQLARSLTLWVAITYTIRAGRIVVTSVRHATTKECEGDFNAAANDVGEAFSCHIELNHAAAATIFARSYSFDMRRAMLGAWKSKYGLVESLGSPDDHPIISWNTMAGPTEKVRRLMDTHIRLPRVVVLADGQRVRNANPLVDIEFTVDGSGIRVLAVSLVRTARYPDGDSSTDGEPNMACYPSGDMFRFTGKLNNDDLLEAVRHEIDTAHDLQQLMRQRWYIMRQFHRAAGSRTRD